MIIRLLPTRQAGQSILELSTRLALVALFGALAIACHAEREHEPKTSGDASVSPPQASFDASGAPLLDASSAPLDSAAAPSVDASPDASAPAAHPFAEFDRAVEDAIRRLDLEDLRGVTAVVVERERGIVHAKGYGGFSADRVFAVAGASQLISAGVLMRLVDRGALELDAPISRSLSAWGEHKRDLTLAHLLSNSAGLPAIDDVRAAEEDPARAAELSAHLCQRREAGTLAECGKAIYQDDRPENNRPPDTLFTLGGSAWQLAGALAEQVSGKSFKELVHETYVEPCGMRSLGYTNPYQRAPLFYPPFFDGDADDAPITDNPSIEGGAYLSARDFGTLLLMHLRGGTCGEQRVLSQAAVERMQQNRIRAVWGGTTGSPVSPGGGFAWWINERSRVLSAAGVNGFYPVLDLNRGYGLIIAIEVDVIVAVDILLSVKPTLDRMFAR